MVVASSLILGLSLLSPTANPQNGELPRRGALGVSLGPVSAAQQAQFKLKAGEGATVVQPLPGLTAEKLGFRAGDVLIKLNGKPFGVQGVADRMRAFPAGSSLKFTGYRDGKPIEFAGQLLEKPRDPGTDAYTVEYSHVVSNGQRMRTILTHPKVAGKKPGFLFIQGYSPVSYDFILATATGDVSTLDGPLLFDFANGGFVTLRIEKPGVGDSEGGPFSGVDYTTELDIYRQALKQLKAQPDVDPNKVFIFGHSMGGAFGPMVASENHVRGIVVYGVAARTWFEYLLESVRYQDALAGASFEAVDESVRVSSRLMALAFHENLSIPEIKKRHPELAQAADGMFPNGMFNAKTNKFWAQLGAINFPRYWALCDTPVLAVHGGSDFVTFDSDHKLIADVVNAKHPSWGTFEVIPNSDHVFNTYATDRESQMNFPRGKYNPAFSRRMMAWMRNLLDKPAGASESR